MTSRNRLVDETSPYLLQHKDNPVHWYPWGEEALTEAKRQDKPILLSVGYAACHWCHVMAHESFKDEAIAEEMNTRFINIKIDREERPDLDAIYQGALAATGQPGGWPLTMFLTPEGHPFWGGTYFPPVSNYGRPSFPDVLQGISDTYKNDKKKVLENVTGINEALIRMIAPTPSSPRALGIDDIDRAAATALGYVDTIHGGTHGAPKFPQTDFFESLWRAYRRSGDVQYKRAVIHTATLICQGGIYDHLAGGFARYSTDHQWLVPHFEKMLYDNALLISLLTTLWRHSRNPLFAQRIEETISWCLRDLHYKNQDGSGGFFSSFDADSEGVEGKFYVWSEAEIDQLLGPDSSDFKRAYNVSAEGNWEGANILHRPATAEPGSADWESRMAICRQVLLKARAARVPPARDDKILADWNGLMITALAEAGAALNRSEWINAAKETFTFVTRHMTAEGNRLLHSWCGGSANHPAVLEDYANLAQGALSLYEITGSQHYLDQAVKWVEIVQTYYADEDGGGYFMAASDTANLIARSKPYADNAVPAGNGTLMQVLAKLHHLTGDDHFRKMTSHVIKGIMAESEAHLTHQATVLMGLETLINPISIVVIGDPDDPETTALVSEILRRDIPTRVLSLLPRDRELPPGHPAHGKSRVDGKPTTYICPGQTCGLPITDKETLKEALTSL